MKGYDLSKHNAIAEKLGAATPKAFFCESNKSIGTTGTIITDAAYSGSPSALEPALPPKSAEAKGLKDSLLSEAIANEMVDSLVFDEVSLDWFQCKNGVWESISKTHSLKLINQKLHQALPNGFSLSKLSSIEAFLRIYLSINKWETSNNLLPMQNGVLDIKKMELINYAPIHQQFSL